MAGVYYTKHMDETLQKSIYKNVPTRDFLGDVGTTKDELFDVGDTVILPGGREMRYCKSTGAGVMIPNMGCNFTDVGVVPYTAFAVNVAKGVSEVTIPAQTHVAVAKDVLKGGYIVVFDGSGTNDITYEITGNDASDADVAFKLTLDMGILNAIEAGTEAVEVYANPWGAIAQSTSVTLPKAGAPVVSVSAAENYFWLQVKGPKFINPQTGVGGDNGGVGVNWRHDGSLQGRETALGGTVPAFDLSQSAGHVISGNAAGNGPLIYLS